MKSPVIESSDYYPFGLTYNNYSRENSLANRFKFQGQERQDELDLGWDSFKWRNHMPEIGRFFNVDPLSEKYVYNSPYAFSENHVTSHVELEGLEKMSIQQAQMRLLRTPQIQASIKSANEGASKMLKLEGGGQVAGIGAGVKAGPFSLSGNARLGAVDGSLAPGNSSGSASLVTVSGGLTGPNTSIGASGSALNVSATSNDGTVATNTSLLSGSYNVQVPTLDQLEVSKSVDGGTVSANTDGDLSVSASLGSLWAKVTVNAQGAGEYISGLVQAVGDFVGGTADAMMHPETTVVPEKLQKENEE